MLSSFNDLLIASVELGVNFLSLAPKEFSLFSVHRAKRCHLPVTCANPRDKLKPFKTVTFFKSSLIWPLF
jgi:hypothetical protein